MRGRKAKISEIPSSLMVAHYIEKSLVIAQMSLRTGIDDCLWRWRKVDTIFHTSNDRNIQILTGRSENRMLIQVRLNCEKACH